MQDNNKCCMYEKVNKYYIYMRVCTCVILWGVVTSVKLGILSNLVYSHDPHSGTGISSVWGIAGPSSRCPGTSSSSIIIYLEQKRRATIISGRRNGRRYASSGDRLDDRSAEIFCGRCDVAFSYTYVCIYKCIDANTLILM